MLLDDRVSDTDAILVSLHILEYSQDKSGATYPDCRDVFISLGRKEESYRKRMHEAKADNLIYQDDHGIFFLIKGLKRLQDLLGKTRKSPVHIIKAGKNFSGIKLFEEFLTVEFEGEEVLICDAHVSQETLFPLTALEGKIKRIKILTSNIYDKDKFDGYIKKIQKELKIEVEVRTSNKIHERYMLSGDSCWSIGASIKDLGNKDTVIKEINEVMTSMRELFLERWNEVEKKE
ncbi:hypothetical protein KW805_02930 [Candidatus Pacearchaeota archaeon]|nr:hypothetical protein [Candidatus Pacearchaeota archaeon]